MSTYLFVMSIKSLIVELKSTFLYKVLKSDGTLFKDKSLLVNLFMSRNGQLFIQCNLQLALMATMKQTGRKVALHVAGNLFI